MKFSIGDIVLLKRTGEEGRVTSFLNHEMIEVEVRGTHFPVFVDEVDHPYLHWFTNKKNKETRAPLRAEDIPIESKKPAPKTPSGFHLAFLPVFKFDAFEDIVEKLKIYFINETRHTISLSYECITRAGTVFSHHTQLQPYGHFYLHDLPFEEMNEQPRFLWMLTQHKDKGHVQTMNDTLRIKPKKLFEYILSLQQEGKSMFTIALAEDFPIAKPPKYKTEAKPILPPPSTATVVMHKRKPIYEIDLHIEKLVGHAGKMTNHEMLVLQLEAFERALDIAISLQQQSMVVIHGVGKGRLREEIHNILRGHAHVSHYICSWNPRYGMGATEIFLQ